MLSLAPMASLELWPVRALEEHQNLRVEEALEGSES